MRAVLIYFREAHLNEENKITYNFKISDFSDQEFVQKIEFLLKSTYYITTLNCKLKVENYIYETQKVRGLSTKSRLLLEKGPAVLCGIDYLMLKSSCYIKKYNHIYQFILNQKIIDQYSYNYKFWDTVEKEIRDGQIYSPYSQFIGKGFNFERKALKGLNLIVRLNEEQTYIESFFLHRRYKGGTEYLNFILGKAYYREINLFCI